MDDRVGPVDGTPRRSASGAETDAMASVRTATSFKLVRIDTLQAS